MVTTIQVSDKLKTELSKRKLFERETYEEVIWNMVEDSTKLDKDDRESLKIAENDLKQDKAKRLV